MSASRDAERRLLLASLAWAGGRGQDLAPLVRAVSRWPRVLAASGRRGIAETLAHALLSSGAAELVPRGPRELLRGELELGAARNALLLSEAARISALLAARGVPSVALKGPALLLAHYAAPGARHVSDLDLLVPRARLADAAEALAGEGPDMRPHFDHRGLPAHVDAHLRPFDTRAGTSCELHFQVPGYRGFELAERLLGGARAVPVPGGGTLRIPEPAECAAIAAVHAYAGHGGEARFLPRLVADLEAIDATAGLDWAAVALAAGAEGEPAVARARELLQAARQGRAEAVFPAGARIVARELVAPFARLARADAAAFVRAFVPTRRFMARRYGVPERSPKLLLYYLARPFLAVRGRR